MACRLLHQLLRSQQRWPATRGRAISARPAIVVAVAEARAAGRAARASPLARVRRARASGLGRSRT
eukprot:3390376-Heterocapsa_arctica.AAC.1